MPGIWAAVKATTLVCGSSAEDHVEVVEVAPRGSHDHHPLLLHRRLPLRSHPRSSHSKWLRPLPIGRSPRGSSPVSRILSGVAIYLRPPVAGRLVRPTRRLRASSPQTPPYSALHRVGLAWPPCHHGAGALLPHHFTFATGRAGVLCNFCGAFPGVSPAGRYPAPCSVVSGLSSGTRSRRAPAATRAAHEVYQYADDMSLDGEPHHTCRYAFASEWVPNILFSGMGKDLAK